MYQLNKMIKIYKKKGSSEMLTPNWKWSFTFIVSDLCLLSKELN